MAAYKSKQRAIKDALVTMLAAIQLDAGTGAEDAFALVTDDPSKDFDTGYPYLLVFPADTQDEHVVTDESQRIVGYTLIMLIPLEDKDNSYAGSTGQLAAYNKMYDLSELVLDALDIGDWHSSLNQIDSSLGTLMVNSSRSGISVGDAKGGSVLICSIDVGVMYTKQL